VAAVSHELRQPLASIRGFTEMLLNHWADFSEAEKLEMLGEVLHEAKRVGSLVDELIGTSRGPGSSPLELRPTLVGLVVAQAVRNLEAVFPSLQVGIEVPDDLPEVMADAFKLEQVVTNVVENAYKYGLSQDVRVTLARRPGRRGEEVAVTVADSGPGIEPQDLPHVTEKFYRSARNPLGGLGLGLWISRQIVEAHGGDLTAVSGPGQGTAITFTIPLRPPAKAGKLAGS